MADRTWKSSAARRRVAAGFDDIFLVYDHLSGQTHCLNFLAYNILELSEAGVIDEVRLIGMLAEHMGLPAADIKDELVASAIGELVRLDLIVPSPCASKSA